MGTFFTRERFGRPQILAGCLLLAFMVQCAWLIAHQPPGAVSPEELARVEQGREQWYGHGIAGTPANLKSAAESIRIGGAPYDSDHSPVWYLIESAPVALFHVGPDQAVWFSLTRSPYVLIGALLGASVWYVSRRLYGNLGGYTALTLYCFSPAVIRASSLWFSPPNIAGAWGTFGAVFTSIAVAHTLYAPREVIWWNWRRILLLGISLALALGSHFSLIWMVPVLLALMLYLAPHRQGAVLAIWATSIAVGWALILASYFFRLDLLARGLRNAQLFGGTWAALGMGGAYLQAGREILGASPVIALISPLAVGVWLAMRPSRYFGNSAPLIMAIFFMLLRVLSPHQAGSIYSLLGVIFLFVFVSGIAADLLETLDRELGIAVVSGLLVASALWDLGGIFAIGR